MGSVGKVRKDVVVWRKEMGDVGDGEVSNNVWESVWGECGGCGKVPVLECGEGEGKCGERHGGYGGK